MRMFYSKVCDHRVCESCLTRFFNPGPAYCPGCPVTSQRQLLSAQDFCQEPPEARQVDSEVKVRRQVSEIFCKTREDFELSEDWNDYLMQREDMIYRLVNPTSQEEVQETWRQIDQYQAQNAEQIRREQRLAPRKKFQKILRIIEEEGSFHSGVNADWGEAPGAAVHPFVVQYQSLLTCPPEDARSRTPSAERSPAHARETSPGSPVPGKTLAGHMSGGGHSPEACVKKARHFFFADLVAATSAASSAPAT
uniref:MAT1 centre domain-containing protein n=1 Tax=Zooxanthella nutricula TaxID=1333877 RepID=A0A7S2P6N6_9DINO